jgi:hypothetical protein
VDGVFAGNGWKTGLHRSELNANMCSMAGRRPERPYLIPFVRVKVAIDNGDLRFLREHAHELPRIRLPDALQICLLYRHQDRERYDAAATKWLNRFAVEAKEASLEDIESAAAALEALPTKPGCGAIPRSCGCV